MRTSTLVNPNCLKLASSTELLLGDSECKSFQKFACGGHLVDHKTHHTQCPSTLVSKFIEKLTLILSFITKSLQGDSVCENP